MEKIGLYWPKIGHFGPFRGEKGWVSQIEIRTRSSLCSLVSSAPKMKKS